MISRKHLLLAIILAAALPVLVRGGQSQAKKTTAGDEPWRHSYMDLPNQVGDVGGVPIYAYGHVLIYGVSPDFQSGVIIQQGAQAPQKKIKPKKSWEMSENYSGGMVSWQPREPRNDFQPTLAVNLIDGDPNTFWMTRGESQPDLMPAWVRIDLAEEETLGEIVLDPVKRGAWLKELAAQSQKGFYGLWTTSKGGAWPKELTVKLSQDGWHWTKVYEGNPSASLKADEPLRVKLRPPIRAKQIWIVANQLPVIDLSLGAECRFALSGVEALDDRGENVALISRGAGVTVSSTFTTGGSTWDVMDQMWPVHYDLGVTWLRLSGSNTPEDFDTLLWRFSERERGKYIGDEKTRKAMAEATANHCRIDVILGYGNWLYAAQPKPEYARLEKGKYPYPYTDTPDPVTKEAMEAYRRWAQFMAGYYKGTVAYWEIQNEPMRPLLGREGIKDPDEQVRNYCDLVKAVAPVIRKTDAHAKISLAGMMASPIAKPSGLPDPEWEEKSLADWLYKVLDQGAGPLVDAIAWHIQGSVVPGTPYWGEYPEAVRAVKRYAESKGFHGKYLASEYWMGAPYPVDLLLKSEWKWNGKWQWMGALPGPLKGTPQLTEVCKAKDAARVYVMNAGLDGVTVWCNTWIQVPLCDGGLFRNGFAADPVIPMQPEPAYYVLRTIATVLDGTTPAELNVDFSNKGQKIEYYAFKLANGGLMIGAWLPGKSVDKQPGVTTDLVVRAPKCSKVVGIDTLNGIEQELNFRRDGSRLVIPGVVIRDYPLMLRLQVQD